MTTNVEVDKQGNENNSSLIRRFSRKVQSSGVIQRVRGTRYFSRERSDNVRRKQKIKQLRRREHIKRLVKLGKLPDKTNRRR